MHKRAVHDENSFRRVINGMWAVGILVCVLLFVARCG